MAACEVNHQKKETQWEKQFSADTKSYNKKGDKDENREERDRPRKRKKKPRKGEAKDGYTPRKKKSGSRLAFGEHRG